MWWRFQRHYLAMASFVIIVCFYLVAAFSGFLAYADPNKSEVTEDTKSFAAALKYILRQDPDVVLVGEMRDLETISSVLTAAETGHLVLATLHSNDACQAIDRVIDVFPPHQQGQARSQLAASLLGIVSQRLLPLKGPGPLLSRHCDGRRRDDRRLCADHEWRWIRGETAEDADAG